ncbi:MAG: hypothetical protein P4L84_22005 [Isosphaeraceae bacterium]|nr:hypothetical protein [Isosphaeraceae bacterium]
MADYVGFAIYYDAPFEPSNLRVLFTTLRAAVRQNWENHRDALSWPRPGGEDLDIDSLLEQTVPEKMKLSLNHDGTLLTDRWITFGFGPLSLYCGLLTVGRTPEGKLFIWLSVCDSEMSRDDFARLRHRVEMDPEFTDPRLLPDPTLNSKDDADVKEYADRLEDVWQENERRSTHLYRDRRAVWAVSAACLRHIFERLSSSLPVEASSIDRQLQPEDGPS